MATEKRPSAGFRPLLVLLLLAAGPMAWPVAAQVQVDESLKRNTFAINQMLRAGRFANTAEQNTFDEFFQKYYLAQWTLDKEIARLPNFRRDLSNQLKKAAGQIHDHLNALVLKFMGELASGPYHPAVQLNAMLMIGELNGVESPPSPMPEALDVLTSALADAKRGDAVRTAALVGIQRHIASKIANEEARKKLTAALLQIATADPPPAADEEGRQWVLAQAIDALGRLGSPGEGYVVFQAMVHAASNAKLPFSTRAAAVESLGRLNYTGVSGIDPLEAATKIAQYLADACAEAPRLAKQAGYSMADCRRWMRQQVGAAALALAGGEDASQKGIASLAKSDQQARVFDLQKIATAIAEFLDDKKNEDTALDGPAEKWRGDLESWLKK